MAEAQISAEELTALRQRLMLAESVCVLYGWCAARMQDDREKAVFELWLMWQRLPGTDTTPQGNPELTDELISDLAHRRDETRARALARILDITEEEARQRVAQGG